MVERPADVLPINKAKPLRFDGFTRMDRAIRRMPGLGVVIVWFLAQWLWTSGHVLGLVLLAGGVANALMQEFNQKP